MMRPVTTISKLIKIRFDIFVVACLNLLDSSGERDGNPGEAAPLPPTRILIDTNYYHY